MLPSYVIRIKLSKTATLEVLTTFYCCQNTGFFWVKNGGPQKEIFLYLAKLSFFASQNACQFTAIAKDSRPTWSLFVANNVPRHFL